MIMVLATAGACSSSPFHHVIAEFTVLSSSISSACGYYAMASLSFLGPLDPVFLHSVGPMITATWVLSISTQLSATSLIAWKIWNSMPPKTTTGLRSDSRSILWIIIESGAIYTFTTALLTAFYLAKTAAGAVVSACLGQISVSSRCYVTPPAY